MANGRFGGGNGASNNPYLIEDAKDLNMIRFNLTSSYKLVNNINLDVYPYNVGSGWAPIDGAFLGSLDGNGKKILNMIINRPNETEVGFFRILGNSATLNSRIQDLSFENAKVTGKTNVGILTGKMVYEGPNITDPDKAYTVERCNFDGTVIAETQTGLVAGFISNSIALTEYWNIMNNVKVSGVLTAKIVGDYYGSAVGYIYAAQNMRFRNIVVDAQFKRLIGAPIGWSFAKFNNATNAKLENVFYNSTKWTGSTTSVTANSVGKTEEQMRKTSEFYDISGDYIKNKNIAVWILTPGEMPHLYNRYLNNFFVLNNGDYYVYRNSKWEKVFEGYTPTREQADKEGIKYLSTIPQEAWDLLQDFEGEIELVNVIETTSGVQIKNSVLDMVQLTGKDTTNRKYFSKKINFSDFGNAISEIKTV